MITQRTRFGVRVEEFCSIDFQKINARIHRRGKIVPFAQLFCVFVAKVLLPALHKKLRMRRSNEQWLRSGACEQLAALSCRGPQNGIHDVSLFFSSELNGFVYCCMFRRSETQKLIQSESQNIPKISVDARSTQA